MAILASAAVKLAGSLSSSRFEKATCNLRENQQALLQRILADNQDTDYGKRHGFRDIKTLRDYAERVPIVDYEDLRSSIARMAAGERAVLTREKPVLYAQTSGTTGDPKLIPVTPSCQSRSNSDQVRTWLYHAQRAHPTLFRGKVASLVSPAVEGHTEDGTPFGSTSGMMYRDLPWLMRRSYALPYELFEVDDYEARYYIAGRLSLRERITFFCTANPSTVLKLAEAIDEHAEQLIRDIRDGTITPPNRFEHGLGRTVSVRPDPELARKLERHRSQRGGRLLPRDYWPNLALVGCWTGGTVGSYVDQLDAYFDPDGEGCLHLRDWGYLASEMRGSVPLEDGTSAGVLTANANVFEFVPTEQVADEPDDRSQWQTLGAHEVEDGGEYHVIVTTTGGLYRYDINDIVRVDGFHNDTPRISFIRKGKGMTNLTGEKVAADHVLQAVAQAGSELGLEIRHSQAQAEIENSRYAFLVELHEEISDERQHRLLEAIEKNLRGINLEYDGKRKSLRLEDPVLYVMASGWHDTAVEQAANTNTRVFQTKVPPLKEADKETLDETRAEATAQVDL
ncbi:MAG: GH3 auxin-responsive promoter family protein [Planctomycetota bacterium]